MDAIKCVNWPARQCTLAGGCAEVCARIPKSMTPIAVKRQRIKNVARKTNRPVFPVTTTYKEVD